MHIQEYLKNKQPYLYQTFLNAIKNDNLSHAYLIVGENGTPLKETALYLAKSLVCDNPNPLACENCITCLRIDNHQYADIIIEDGAKGNINKGNINHIINTFSKTSIENKGKVIYVIHLVETMQVAALNTLLKFLEEPSKNAYAFLTTQNESRVLPTIISRTQRLVLRLTPRDEIINECKVENISLEDSELLSYFYNDVEIIKNVINSDDYQTLKECLKEIVHNIKNSNDLMYIVQTKIIPNISNKDDAKILIDMLSSVFEDIIRKKNNEKIFLTSYGNIISDLSKTLPHLESSLLELIKVRSELDINITIASVFEHLAVRLAKE